MEKTPKKRGRKPKNTVKKEEKKPLTDLKKRTDNIILYLPVGFFLYLNEKKFVGHCHSEKFDI